MTMPTIKAEFRVNSKNWARFEGHVWADGATGSRSKAP